MDRTTPERALRGLGARLLCAEHLDPADPDFLRVCALNGAIVLLGGAGLAFAVFNTVFIATPDVAWLVGFDLGAFAAGCALALYLRWTRDIGRSAMAADLLCFAAFIVLVAAGDGGEYFVLWTMLYPPLAFMLGGLRRGAVHTGVFLALLFGLAIANVGDWNHGALNAVALSNLVGATLVLTGIMAVFECARRNALAHSHARRAEMEHQSVRDALTGLFNRRGFRDVLRDELARVARGDRMLALIVFDIDHFKAYNDRYGHPAGDRVLEQIGALMTTLFRRTEDAAFRIGGEEFAAICTVRDAQEALARAESVRAGVEGLSIPSLDAPPGYVTASVGVGVFRGGPPINPDMAYTEVDRALYRAKFGGRNRVMASEQPVTDTA